MTSPYLDRPIRSLEEALADLRAEAASLPAYHHRLAWLLSAIATIEGEIALRRAAAAVTEGNTDG